MRTEALDRVTLVFTLFDADGDGFIGPDDFELMGSRVLQAAPEADDAAKAALSAAFRRYWTTLAAELDADHDGRISLEEFRACVLAPERFADTIDDFAVSLAAMGDPDGDGLIERPLFVALMLAIGFELPNIHALFDAFEPDDADRVTVPVWVTAIKDYYAPDKAGTSGDYLVAIPSA